MTFRIATRLAEDTVSKLQNEAESDLLLDGRAMVQIGQYFVGGSAKGEEAWLEGMELDEFLMTFVQAARKLRRDRVKVSMNFSGLVLQLEASRSGDLVLLSQRVIAPSGQVIPALVSIEQEAVPYIEFCHEIQAATTRFLREVGSLNPAALESFMVTSLSGEAKHLVSEERSKRPRNTKS